MHRIIISFLFSHSLEKYPLCSCGGKDVCDFVDTKYFICVYDMYYSASSEAPQNLLELLVPVWSEVVDTVVLSSSNGASISFCLAQSDNDTTTAKQTRYAYLFSKTIQYF